MSDTYGTIPALLHEARLTRLRWEPERESLCLRFDCLRRNEDGSTIPDPSIELRLEGVQAIAAYYAPASVEVRPSEFAVDALVTAADLQEWRRPPHEVSLAIDSPHADFDMATACVIDWLVGDPSAEPMPETSASLGIHVRFDNHAYGRDAVSRRLYISCQSIQPFAGGQPLSVDQWRRQFEAWWQGWEEHWSSQETEHVTDDLQPIREDTFIPAGEDHPPDLSYCPPSRPPFELTSTDAPAELLQPLEDFHVGLHERHWVRMASAYPDLDKNELERADELKARYLEHEFGRWDYVRCIDSWWQEGPRAGVVVRGIEHSMPDDDDPARNEETVLTYGLRKYRGQWIIWTWQQGWPQYGSAPHLTGEQSWRKDWELA